MENNLWKTRNLRLNVARFLLVGGTGNGKTDFTNVLTTEKVFEVLGLSVGETNSTLNSRNIIYSNAKWLLNSLVVAVKISNEVITKEAFEQTFITSLAEVIIDVYGKSKLISIEEQYFNFKTKFLENCDSKVNTKATLSYLSESQKEDLADNCTKYLKSVGFIELYGFTIYNESKNQVDLKDSKSKTHLLKVAIQRKIEDKFNHLGEEIKANLLDIHNNINAQVKELYKKYFDENDISKDGYYYKIIDLDDLEASRDFIDAFFTANNLNENEALSIELLFEDIVIYVPLSEDVLNLIDQSQLDRLKGPDDNVYLSVIDTKGLFHEDFEEDENVAYLQDLLYRFEYDALILMAPLSGDTNSEKLKSVYLKALKGFKREVPIFILQNKVDLLINSLKNKPSSQRSRFTKETVKSDIKIADVENAIKIKTEIFNTELLKVIKLNPNFVTWITCSLINVFEEEEFYEKYGLVSALESLLKNLTESLSNRSNKFTFELNGNADEISHTYVDSGLIERLLLVRIESEEVQSKIVNPSIKNIAEELGKVPHGSSLKALVKRLSLGLGYHSNINENYWVYFKNIFVDFPGNLNNLSLNNHFLNALISEKTLLFEGGRFKNEEDQVKLIELIKKQFSSRNFVANLIYYKIYLFARNMSIGNGDTYNNFLNTTHYYLSKPSDVIKAYEEALIKELDRCVKLICDIYIRYE